MLTKSAGLQPIGWRFMFGAVVESLFPQRCWKGGGRGEQRWQSEKIMTMIKVGSDYEGSKTAGGWSGNGGAACVV